MSLRRRPLGRWVVLSVTLSPYHKRTKPAQYRHHPESRAVSWEGRTLLTVISCPDCGVPAEVTERFSLLSTDGPVKHLALSCAAGHHFRMAVDRLPEQAQEQLAGQETRTKTRTVQICIHCMENPAGFWVSRRSSKVVHRPWCLSCCQELDPGLCDVTPFGA
jgi:hypothetical protein